MAIGCAKAQVGTCCTDERTGKPAWKYSQTNVYIGSSCADARQAYCMSHGGYGTKNCPAPLGSRFPAGGPAPRGRSGPAITTSQTDPYGKAPASRLVAQPAPKGQLSSRFPNGVPDRRAQPPISNRPKAQMPQCGTMYGNRGFTCCCKGMAGCGPDGYMFFKDRAGCCKTFGTAGGRCFGDSGPAPTQSRAPSLPSRFGQGSRDRATQIYNFPGGERAPSGDGGGTATAPTGPAGADTGGGGGDTTPKDVAGVVAKLCPYFAWMPIGTGAKDCNLKVLAGAAVVILGGALLIKVMKGR